MKTLAWQIARDYVNGNLSDVKKAIQELSPMDAAAIVLRAQEILRGDGGKEWLSFNAFIRRQSEGG